MITSWSWTTKRKKKKLKKKKKPQKSICLWKGATRATFRRATDSLSPFNTSRHSNDWGANCFFFIFGNTMTTNRKTCGQQWTAGFVSRSGRARHILYIVWFTRRSGVQVMQTLCFLSLKKPQQVNKNPKPTNHPKLLHQQWGRKTWKQNISYR